MITAPSYNNVVTRMLPGLRVERERRRLRRRGRTRKHWQSRLLIVWLDAFLPTDGQKVADFDSNQTRNREHYLPQADIGT